MTTQKFRKSFEQMVSKFELDDKQIQAYEAWEEKWNLKPWSNERLDELLSIVKPGSKRVGEVMGRFSIVDCICVVGHEFGIRPNDILSGHFCKKCAIQKATADEEFYRRDAEQKNLTMFGFLAARKEAMYICKYANIFFAKPKQIKRGEKKCQCPQCKSERPRRKPRTIEESIAECSEKGFKLLEPWKGAHKKHRFLCLTCGNVIEKTPHSILNKNQGCPHCSGNNQPTKEEIVEYLAIEGDQLKDPDNFQYKNSDEKIDAICKYGHEFSVSWNHYKHKRSRCPICFRERHSKRMSGENNPNYDHDKSPEERAEEEAMRKAPEYFATREACFLRDYYTCQITNIQYSKNKLNYHHLDGFNWCKEKRYDLNNAITLHQDIHNEFHRIYGRGNNTVEQFIQFIERLIQSNPHEEERLFNLINTIYERQNQYEFSHLEKFGYDVSNPETVIEEIAEKYMYGSFEFEFEDESNFDFEVIQ